jgi:hypothetical protein
MHRLTEAAMEYADKLYTPEEAMGMFAKEIVRLFCREDKQMDHCKLLRQEHDSGYMALTYKNTTQLMHAKVEKKWWDLGTFVDVQLTAQEKQQAARQDGVLVLILLLDKQRLLANQWMDFGGSVAPPTYVIPYVPCTHCGNRVAKAQKTKVMCPDCGEAIFCSLACLEKSQESKEHVKACLFIQKCQGLCHFCSTRSKKRCSRCKTYYCSEVCRTKDKEVHQKLCVPNQ